MEFLLALLIVIGIVVTTAIVFVLTIMIIAPWVIGIKRSFIPAVEWFLNKVMRPYWVWVLNLFNVKFDSL